MNSTPPQLITYVDRLAGTVTGVRDLLETRLAGMFGGIHLLPYFTPFDGADAGFDPSDHTRIDPRLGTWDDVRALSGEAVVMSDVIVNHVSAESDAFQDVRRRGDASPFAAMFLTLDAVFPDGAREDDLARIYRPRPGLPFTVMELGGRKRLVWTTFTADQVDIDLRTEVAWDYLVSVIDALAGAGVTMLRLDAVGYTGKEAGTDCFMTASTDRYTQRILALAHERGMQVLLEVHGHFTQQIDIARSVDYVYDFALPPLVLHALHAHDLRPLAQWLAVRPANTITVLDTHDGIGIVDVGESDLKPGVPGLLAPAQIDALVEAIHAASGGTSRLATGAAASNLDLYQVNCTYYDAVGADDRAYLLARLIQLMVPGIPQVYYVGLFAGPWASCCGCGPRIRPSTATSPPSWKTPPGCCAGCMRSIGWSSSSTSRRVLSRSRRPVRMPGRMPRCAAPWMTCSPPGEAPPPAASSTGWDTRRRDFRTHRARDFADRRRDPPRR